MGAGGGGSSGGVSAAQMGQLMNSMKQANAGRQAAESEAELMGIGGGSSGGGGTAPRMDDQYLSAMDQDRIREYWEKMIAGLGTRGGGY